MASIPHGCWSSVAILGLVGTTGGTITGVLITQRRSDQQRKRYGSASETGA